LFAIESATTAEKPRRTKPKPKAPVDATWQRPMRDAGIATLDTQLRDMNPDQIYALSRLGKYEYGNCRRDERKNRSAAIGFAKGLAGMARSRDYGDVTGQEFMDAAKRVYELGGGVPLHDAWAVIAGFDWSPPQEAQQ